MGKGFGGRGPIGDRRGKFKIDLLLDGIEDGGVCSNFLVASNAGAVRMNTNTVRMSRMIVIKHVMPNRA